MVRSTTTSFAPSPPPPPPVTIARHPSDAELIAKHLWPHVHSSSDHRRHRHNSSSSFVHHDASAVYSADPASLTRRFAAARTRSGRDREAWYFFTKVQAKDGRGENRAVVHGEGRTTAAATWHGDAGLVPVDYYNTLSGKHATGYLKHFSFREKKQRGGGRGVRTGWRMKELRLDLPGHDGRGHRQHGQDEEEKEVVLVLCKLYRSRRPPSSSSNGAKPPPPLPEPAPAPAEEGRAAGLEIQWGGKRGRNWKPAAEPPAEEDGWAKIGWERKGKRGRQIKGGGDDDDDDGGRKNAMKICPCCHADLSLPHPKLLVPKIETELDARVARMLRSKVKEEMLSLGSR